jgi:hypothetical protein
MIDRRKEFLKKPWIQGFMIWTSITRRFNKEEVRLCRDSESKRAFVNFTSEDEGRSRILIYVYANKRNCKRAIIKHNLGLKKNEEDF